MFQDVQVEVSQRGPCPRQGEDGGPGREAEVQEEQGPSAGVVAPRLGSGAPSASQSSSVCCPAAAWGGP